MNNNRKQMARGLKALAGITISLALLGVLIWWQPVDEYITVWKEAAVWPVVLAYALTVPMVALRTRQTQSLARLQGMTVKYRPLLALQLATTFYGLFVPGIVAVGVLRWYRLAQLGGDPKATFALVVFSRLLEIEMALFLGLGFWLLDPIAPGGPGLPVMFFLLGAATTLVRYIAFHPRTARHAQSTLARRWPPNRFASARSKIVGLLDVTARYGTLTHRAWALLLANILGGQALGLLSVVLIAMALGMDASWMTLGWARSILSIAMLLPITWAGIGLREATLAGALVAAGQPAAASVALGLLLSLRVVLEAAAGGIVELRAWLSPLPHKRSSS